MGRVGLRDRVRGGAKGPHRAGRRAPASLRPVRHNPVAHAGPPPLTIGRRAALHRGRKNLPRRWCPARMRVAPPAGRMPPELQQRSQRAERRHDPSALGVHAAAAAGGGGAERVRLPAATAACTRSDSSSALRHAACGTVAGDVNACLSGRSPRAAAWSRHTVTAKASTPQVGMARGARLTCGLLAL